MSYKALYRTYRPMTFEEVAGQKHIVQTLKNAIKENKIAHAYLFCGPRGTGKTTMARLFAKGLNCEEGFGCQCNNCTNCISITAGTHPDVIEIDAASNRGIDDIRAIIDRVRYAPIKGKYKVYIIDEVHMLTTEAFNALLKTLEEPPSNVVFILATTEPYKLMPTILSRCQRYDFTKVPNPDLFLKLKYICEQENIEADEDALSLIVSLADGGVRDALSMLDQTIAYASNNIKAHHINEIFGLSSKEEKIDILLSAKENDIAKLTLINDNLINKGIDVRRLTQDLLTILKDLLIIKTGADETLLKIITKEDSEKLDFTSNEINEMIDILLSTFTQYRFVASANSLFEITLLKLASVTNKNFKTVESSVKILEPEIKEVSVELNKKEKNNKSEETNQVLPFSESGESIIFSDDDILNIMVQANKQEKQIVLNAWNELINLLLEPVYEKYVHTLQQCFARIVSHDVIILEATFNNIVNKVNLMNNQEGFKQILKKLTDRDYLIICLSHAKYQDIVSVFKEKSLSKQLPSIKPIDIKIK